MSIIQLSPPIEVTTKKFGKGWAVLVLDYGLNLNTIWVVRLSDGCIKHFDSNDIYITENPMLGQEKILFPT